MKIEQEFLPLIFEDDLIYVTEKSVAQVITPAKEIIGQAKKEEPTASKELVNEAGATYNSPNSTPIQIMVDSRYKDSDKVLLGNILKALNTELSEVTILREHPEEFKKGSSTSLFICFDDALVKSNQYELNQIFQTKVIYAHSLSTLDGQKVLKMSLWKLLKKLN